MTATTPLIRRRPHHLGYVCAVLPLLRWLIAIHTVPSGQPWRYHCAGCATTVWPTACGPSGRCRTCGTRTGAPPYAVEIIAVAALGLLTWSTTPGWELAAYTWWTTGMLALAFVDAAVLRLPHRLTIATTIGTVLILAPTGAPSSSWRSATIGAAALAGGYMIVRAVSQGDLGFGDVAVAIPVGLILGWLGWRQIVAAVLLAHTLAVATIPIRRLTGRTGVQVPLGTYLISASFTVIVATGIL